MATYWLIWDAASKDIVDQMLKEEKLPNVKKVYENGFGCRVKLKQFNCQTPCALAVQFTGIPLEKLKMGGYDTPNVDSEDILGYTSAFKNEIVGEHVVWHRKVIGEKRGALCQIPFYKKQQNMLYPVDGFAHHKHKAQCIKKSELSWREERNETKYTVVEIFGTKFILELYEADDGELRTILTDTKTDRKVRVQVDNCVLQQNNFLWLDYKSGFRFYAYTLEDGDIIFIFTDVYQYNYDSIKDVFQFRKENGPFFGRALGKMYRNGRFGKPIYDSGGGKAEKIYMNLLKNVADYFDKLNTFIIRQDQYDFVISYQPCIDEMSHEIYGWYLEHPENQVYKDMLYESYQLADQHLGSIFKLAGEEDNVFLSSDHGIYSVNKVFYLNEYLRRKRMLVMTEEGKIDIQKSKAFFHPANTGALFLNPMLAQGERETLMCMVENIQIEDQKMISKVTNTKEKKIFGDYFIEPADNINIRADLSGEILEETNKRGCHTWGSEKKSMNAIFYGCGKQVRDMPKDMEIYNYEIKEIVGQCLKKS